MPSPNRRAALRTTGVLGAAALLPAITGCAMGRNPDAVTFFCQANPEELQGRLRLIAEFHRRHPDITIDPILSTPDPMQQMSTFCAGGKCPDVLMSWELTFAGLADRGVLADLNPFLARDPEFAGQLLSQSADLLFDTFGWDNAQYALPEQWSGNFLYYNRKLFEEAGAKPPPKRWEEPWSFGEFLETAQRLTKRDSAGKIQQYGFVDTWVPYYTAGLFGANNGTPWSDPRKKPSHIAFDDDAFVEGVQFYADLANKYRVAPTPAAGQSISPQDRFANGTAAMAVGGHWRYQTFLQEDDLDFDLTILPTGPRGHQAAANIGTTGLAISATSPRKEKAWEFVKFMTGPIGQQLIGESGLFVPALRSARQSAEFAHQHTRIANLAVLTEGPNHSGPLPITPQWERVDALMDRDFGAVLRGNKPAEFLRTALSPAVDEVLTSP